ncbi:hypothetical protein BB347_18555 (plasmid) [Natronorubrum daqingense]|uniref:Uncharacterized protein n=1 Tax=Natronorubrum daqingense TaxID=588898 RepID=A0A1P8RJ83_9EURY|nr:hypothetical protein BB347_18555 [Natronorubrum daqingense]
MNDTMFYRNCILTSEADLKVKSGPDSSRHIWVPDRQYRYDDQNWSSDFERDRRQCIEGGYTKFVRESRQFQ